MFSGCVKKDPPANRLPSASVIAGAPAAAATTAGGAAAAAAATAAHAVVEGRGRLGETEQTDGADADGAAGGDGHVADLLDRGGPVVGGQAGVDVGEDDAVDLGPEVGQAAAALLDGHLHAVGQVVVGHGGPLTHGHGDLHVQVLQFLAGGVLLDGNLHLVGQGAQGNLGPLADGHLHAHAVVAGHDGLGLLDGHLDVVRQVLGALGTALDDSDGQGSLIGHADLAVAA